MAVERSPRLLLFLLVVVAPSFRFRSSASASASALCPRSHLAFLDAIESQSPLWIDRSSPPLEVDGETLERELAIAQESAYYSILFYSSRCPFSSSVRPIFEALSSMFPQITHLAVEESSSMPSVFSRYWVHSFPAILLANGTLKVRYHGQKDLNSLVNFYKEATGLDPVAYLAVDQPSYPRDAQSLWSQFQSLREIMNEEPYLILSLLFIFIMAMMLLFPVISSHLRAIWASHALHLNMGVIGSLSHLLERALHIVDIKRLWSKLRLFNKTRNLRKGASNARAWASSFTSVSLGEPSSSRIVPLGS